MKGDNDEVDNSRWWMESLSGRSVGWGFGDIFSVCHDSMDGENQLPWRFNHIRAGCGTA
jgi:hypothetical protein